MLNYPSYVDRYDCLHDYPCQQMGETFLNACNLFLQFQIDIWDIRPEYLLSEEIKDYETSFC